jgi:hypothetical protein
VATGSWRLQDAKARFSELARRLHTKGPQHVSVHDLDEGVVLSAEEFRCFNRGRTGNALIVTMHAMPHPKTDDEPWLSGTNCHLCVGTLIQPQIAIDNRFTIW